MKEGTSIEGHLTRMKELTDKLTAIGAPISEEDQVVTLLGSLPPGYATLVTALESRVEDISFNYVQQALVHEEQKLQKAKYTVDSQKGYCAPGSNLRVSAVANQATFDENAQTNRRVRARARIRTMQTLLVKKLEH